MEMYIATSLAVFGIAALNAAVALYVWSAY
jgi:hypothetical protein